MSSRSAAKARGGLSEFVEQLQDDAAGWGYVRLNMSNDQYSQRVKFVLVSWCGAEVKPMRRAKLSIQISDVKQVLRSFHIEIATSDRDDLDEAKVLLRLRQVGGANYDRQNSDY